MEFEYHCVGVSVNKHSDGQSDTHNVTLAAVDDRQQYLKAITFELAQNKQVGTRKRKLPTPPETMSFCCLRNNIFVAGEDYKITLTVEEDIPEPPMVDEEDPIEPLEGERLNA